MTAKQTSASARIATISELRGFMAQIGPWAFARWARKHFRFEVTYWIMFGRLPKHA